MARAVLAVQDLAQPGDVSRQRGLREMLRPLGQPGQDGRRLIGSGDGPISGSPFPPWRCRG